MSNEQDRADIENGLRHWWGEPLIVHENPEPMSERLQRLRGRLRDWPLAEVSFTPMDNERYCHPAAYYSYSSGARWNTGYDISHTTPCISDEAMMNKEIEKIEEYLDSMEARMKK